MRSSLLSLITAALAALLMQSCSGVAEGDVDLLPVKGPGSQLWILIDPDGSTASDSMAVAPTMAVNGFFSFSDSTGISVVSANPNSGRRLFINGLTAAGVMSENRIPVVRPNHRIDLLDSNGDSITTLMPVDGHEIDAAAPFFSSGRMIVHVADGSSNGQFGAVDTDGKIVVEPIYDRLYAFHGNYALAECDSVKVMSGSKKQKAKKTKNTLRYIIDRDGREILTLPDNMKPLSEGVFREVMPVKYNDSLGFVNIKGRFIAAPKNVKKIIQATDRCFVYTNKKGRMGVYTIQGDTILPPRFSDIQIVDDNHFIVSNSEMDHPSLIDRSAEVLAEFEGAKSVLSLSKLFPFRSEFRFVGVMGKNSYALYDKNGKLIPESKFAEYSTRIIINPKHTRSGDMVASDYFDITAAADQFINPLNSAGYAKAKLGFTVKNLTSSAPEKLTSQQSLRILSAKGHRYEITATAYTAAPIANSTPIYKEKSDSFWSFLEPDEVIGHNYEFNPKATVTKIVVKLTTESRTFSQTRQKIENRIAKANYKEEESTESFSVFKHRGEKRYIVMIPMAMQKGTAIYILNNSQYSSSIATLKREANINFALN